MVNIRISVILSNGCWTVASYLPGQKSRETAMRVTGDALAVETPICMLGGLAYDSFDCHDHLPAAGVVPVAPYNPRNTDDPLDIEYRVEDRIEEQSRGGQLIRIVARQSGIDRTIACGRPGTRLQQSV